jgi:amidase
MLPAAGRLRQWRRSGARSGLPVGLQIIAPMWEDGTSIEFAALLSDLIGGFTAPPAFQE